MSKLNMKVSVTAKAPVNIAVIKYWGKQQDKLKIPINDSLSGTLNMDDMCTTTSVLIDETIKEDSLYLNGEEQNLHESSPAKLMIERIRSMTPIEELSKMKTKIVSNNNFPTAAGLASSAAGYACLAFALGHAYGIQDQTLLSKIARAGSGSACRSLFGGFVHWIRGSDHDTSLARQVVDENHWPDMRVVICVVNDAKKEISSSLGMAQSVKTSPLLQYRATKIVQERLETIKNAIIERDFEKFAEITMKESNEFHAICLDTFPPIFYLNETSRHIISICHLINQYIGQTKVAYTFDAGPNACIYLLKDFVPTFIGIINHFFPLVDHNSSSMVSKSLHIRGRPHHEPSAIDINHIVDHLKSSNVRILQNSIRYLISTSIGGGPELVLSD